MLPKKHFRVTINMKYSFIIPVYNVENTLEACVESVLAQEGSYEIILVDDKSPDSSGEICDRLSEKYSRVRTIHKPVNEGLGFARNTGLEASTGDFIVFVDSDDTISPDFLEVENARVNHDMDILVYGVDTVYLDENGCESWRESLHTDRVCSYEKDAVADAFLTLNRERIFPFAWNKVYRKQFLLANGLQFEQTRLIEDFLFNIAAFGCASRVVISPVCHYNYMRPAHETMVNSYCPEFFELCKRKYSLEYDFLKKKNALTPEATELIKASYFKHLISVFVRNRSEKAGLSASQQKKLISEMLNDELTDSVMADYMPQGKKMLLMSLPVRRKMTNLCYLMGYGADMVQNKNMKFFKTVLRK